MAKVKVAAQVAERAEIQEILPEVREMPWEAPEAPRELPAVEPGETVLILGMDVEKARGRCPVTGQAVDLFYDRTPRPYSGSAPWSSREHRMPVDRQAPINDELSPRGRFHRIRESVRLRPDPESPAAQATELKAEIARLRDLGMHTVADLVSQGRPTAREAPIAGLIRISTLLFSQSLLRLDVSDEEARELVARHVAGDWGELGSIESGRAGISAESRFAPALYPREVQNAVALERGHGLVLSSFDVYRPRVDRGGSKRHPDSRVRVATLIGTGEPSQTIVFTNLDGNF